jgi:hypothetical protein
MGEGQDYRRHNRCNDAMTGLLTNATASALAVMLYQGFELICPASRADYYLRAQACALPLDPETVGQLLGGGLVSLSSEEGGALVFLLTAEGRRRAKGAAEIAS